MSTTIVEHKTEQVNGHDAMPPLHNGDRLTRHEFHRRYLLTLEDVKAELIEGIVYMASPVKATHGRPHSRVMTWLGLYYLELPNVDLLDNTTVLLDLDNEPQPDALLRLEPEVGGKSVLTDDNYIEGPPELVVEIAASSAAYDLHDKKNAFRRNGVQEYLVWQVYEERIDWWELRDGAYVPLEADDGVIRSRAFPGLWLASTAIVSGDMQQVRATLQAGMQSEEHAAFVRRLKGEA